MKKLDELKDQLNQGQVYRRADMEHLTKSPDRHLAALVIEGTLQKLSPGLYYYPKETVFGKTPPKETKLIHNFLKDNRFLVTSPNAYNSLGVETTQLYNQRTVYNHKRHGEFKLGNRSFSFRMKHHFPTKLTEEFLLVDLMNNLDKLAEDKSSVLEKIRQKVRSMDTRKLARAVSKYGSTKTQKLLKPLFLTTTVA
jgi:hypothetical protein